MFVLVDKYHGTGTKYHSVGRRWRSMVGPLLVVWVTGSFRSSTPRPLEPECRNNTRVFVRFPTPRRSGNLRERPGSVVRGGRRACEARRPPLGCETRSNQRGVLDPADENAAASTRVAALAETVLVPRDQPAVGRLGVTLWGETVQDLVGEAVDDFHRGIPSFGRCSRGRIQPP